MAGLTAGAGLVSMVGALDVGEALTGARSGASGTATVGAGLTAGASGFGEGVSASAELLRDPSLQGGSEQHPDTEFERGRTCFAVGTLRRPATSLRASKKICFRTSDFWLDDPAFGERLARGRR